MFLLYLIIIYEFNMHPETYIYINKVQRIRSAFDMMWKKSDSRTALSRSGTELCGKSGPWRTSESRRICNLFPAYRNSLPRAHNLLPRACNFVQLRFRFAIYTLAPSDETRCGDNTHQPTYMHQKHSIKMLNTNPTPHSHINTSFPSCIFRANTSI